MNRNTFMLAQQIFDMFKSECPDEIHFEQWIRTKHLSGEIFCTEQEEKEALLLCENWVAEELSKIIDDMACYLADDIRNYAEEEDVAIEVYINDNPIEETIYEAENSGLLGELLDEGPVKYETVPIRVFLELEGAIIKKLGL